MRIYLTPEIEIEEISVVDVIATSGETGNNSPSQGDSELPGRPIAASLGTSENGGDSADITSVGDTFGNF